MDSVCLLLGLYAAMRQETWIYTSLIAAIVMAWNAPIASSTCPANGREGCNGCFWLIEEGDPGYSALSEQCADQGGHPVIIADSDFNECLIANVFGPMSIKQSVKFYIGLTKDSASSPYVWYDGTAMGWGNNLADENSGNNKFCVIADQNQGLDWKPWKCENGGAASMMCQKGATPRTTVAATAVATSTAASTVAVQTTSAPATTTAATVTTTTTPTSAAATTTTTPTSATTTTSPSEATTAVPTTSADAGSSETVQVTTTETLADTSPNAGEVQALDDAVALAGTTAPRTTLNAAADVSKASLDTPEPCSSLPCTQHIYQGDRLLYVATYLDGTRAMRLNNHVIESPPNVTLLACASKCLLKKDCLSINFRINEADRLSFYGGCEVNKANASAFPDDVTAEPNYRYFEVPTIPEIVNYP